MFCHWVKNNQTFASGRSSVITEHDIMEGNKKAGVTIEVLLQRKKGQEYGFFVRVRLFRGGTEGNEGKSILTHNWRPINTWLFVIITIENTGHTSNKECKQIKTCVYSLFIIE